jgi:hypothetical protein
VMEGRVRVEQAGVGRGEARSREDGAFEIEMTCQRPLPPGDYEVIVAAPGYASVRWPLTVVIELTMYSVGRVELRRVGDASR